MWTATPACLRDALNVELDASLGAVVTAQGADSADACVCQTKENALNAGEKLARILEKLPDLGGASNAETLRKTLVKPGTRFGCGPN